jgi:hypothetical protein
MFRRPAILGAAASATVLIGAATAAGFGTFKPAQTTEMSGYAYQVATGDINRDGLGDVIVANGEGKDDHIEILRGKRNGSYRAPKRVVSTGESDGVAVGRLNGDRRLDIAVANYNNDDVTPFIQRRNGSFRKRGDLPGGPGNWQVAIADLNRDGHGDIITSNYSNTYPDDAVSVHLGKAKGFKAVQSYPGGETGMGLQVGRLNGDRRPDVVGVTEDGVVSPYLARRNGTLRLAVFHDIGGADSYSPVALGDFTGEGDLDAIVANYDTDSLTLLRGDGQGGFVLGLKKLPEVPGVWGVAAANLNGKGGPDLAVNLYDDEQVQVLRGTGDGEFVPGAKYDLSDIPESIAIGRVGKDRGLDILVGTDTSLDTFLNKPNP